MHVLGHKGEELSVRGPLNIARPIQGWPVIVQAGASEAGRQIAAETAEAVFGASATIEEARAFYADVKGRMDRLGRNRDHMKILPGCFVVVGETEDGGEGEAGASSTAWCTTPTPSARCRWRSASMPRTSTRTARCRRSRRPRPASPAASAPSAWRGART